MVVEPTLIHCENLTKTYSGEILVEALKPATFTIQSGEKIVVCGPSGSGKSTLMNLLGLLDTPTSGTYEFLGQDMTLLGEAGRSAFRAASVGFVFQAFHLLSGRSATENVAAGLMYSGVPRQTRTKRALDVLERVGLAHRAHADVVKLSGGERQRVAVARAIVHEPQLLLADEPTGNLDSQSSETVLELLDELNQAGYTQILVTHDHDIADRFNRRLDVHDGVVTDSASSISTGVRADD